MLQPLFSSLMDKFLSGLHDVLALSHLDDIIVLSPTFEKHLCDLEHVLKRLSLFKLHANREKCHLCREKVKNFGHYITKGGITEDSQKAAIISNMPSPKRFSKSNLSYKPSPVIADKFRIFLK